MKTHKFKCGCVCEVGDRERWVSLCAEHETEFQAIHRRWGEEHRARLNEVPERKLKLDDLK